MARRWRREPEYVWWIALLGLGVLAWFLRSWRVGLLVLLAWCLYEFSLIPTVCRVTTREGFSCSEPVRGRLYACSRHQQVKGEALWRLVGLTGPPFRGRTVGDPNRETGVVVYSPPVRGRLTQTDRNLLVLAALGTVGVVVGMAWGLFDL